MSHKDALKALTPLELRGDVETDLVVEGNQFDATQADLETLRQTIRDSVTELKLGPPGDDLIRMATAQMDVKKPFFVRLAAAMGYTIRIEDYIPLMAGWICAGDEVLEEQWIDFSAGVSGAGDSLGQIDGSVLPFCWKVVVIGAGDGPVVELEALINDLAPAHRLVNFEYINH